MPPENPDSERRSHRQTDNHRPDGDHRSSGRHSTRHNRDDGGSDRRHRSRDRRRHRDRRSRSPEGKRRRRGSRERDTDRDGRRSQRDRRSRRDDSDDDASDRDRARDRDRDRKRRRSRSRSKEYRKDRHRDRDRDRDRDSRPAKRESEKLPPAEPVRRSGPLPSQADSFAVVETGGTAEPDKPKEKPNYGSTGVLAAASNSVVQADGSTITLKYHEPPEARKPPARDDWRLFVFKGADLVDTIPLASRSCWLVGRDVAVVDLPAAHPSISKQHAVVQFRHVEKKNEFGDRIGGVKPYLIDLESANGTMLNGDRVPDSRYLELRHKDVVKFGLSEREYVVMLASKE